MLALLVGTFLVVEPPSAAPTSAPGTTAPAPRPLTVAPARGEPSPWRTSRLQIAVAAVLGPHAFGNTDCREDGTLCDRAGRFLGGGGTLELRVGLWRGLTLHARGLFVGNMIRHRPVYAGLAGGGAGVGWVGRRILVRGEVLGHAPLGDPTFEGTFDSKQRGEARWTHVAGLVSAGMRHRFSRRVLGEAWAGLTIGPRETRTFLDETERRVLLSFLIGIGVAIDVVP